MYVKKKEFRAIIAYIVHFNLQRNECAYKMVYGSIFKIGTREEAQTSEQYYIPLEQQHHSGLREKEVDLGDGQKEEFWVRIIN